MRFVAPVWRLAVSAGVRFAVPVHKCLTDRGLRLLWINRDCRLSVAELLWGLLATLLVLLEG